MRWQQVGSLAKPTPQTCASIKKLTQTELAGQVGLSYIQIGRYETNKSSPSADVLHRLAAALDATTDFLMKGTEDEYPIGEPHHCCEVCVL